MHSLNIGKFELTIVSDGTYYLDAGSMFGVVPKVMWSERYKPDAQNRMACGTNSVLVRGCGKTVLIETGIGDKLGKLDEVFEPKHLLLENLKTAGVQPDDVDIVINSHLHFDHCGWNTMRNANGAIQPTFPNARYFAQRGEWEHAQEQHERDRISYIGDNYNPLIESGCMSLLQGSAQICEGIRVQVFPGHTRWMQAIFIESEGQTACYISDLIPTSHHLDLGWVMAFDVMPISTIDSKKLYYQTALNAADAPRKFLTIFTHDHEVPWMWLKAGARGRVVGDPA
jgi:glyoxylase-like metal-dependent hydrolase (beta-lactamase superfamily II)